LNTTDALLDRGKSSRRPYDPAMPSVTISDVQAARGRIASHLRPTPVVPSQWLSDASGGTVLLKLESLQVTSSFKSRGALNAAMQLVEAQGRNVTIVTASAGNHGRAVAWAAEQLGIKAIVFTPRTAPETKTRAILKHGADLRAVAANYEEAERLAQQHARDTGDVFVSAYSHPDVIAGAGTVGLELLEDVPDVQAVLVPVGGGGLISGVATAIKGLDPRVEVIGVEVDASCAFAAARAAGRIVEITVGETIADGLGGNVDPNTITWPIIRDLVNRIVVVPEGALRQAVRTLIAEDHLVAEGAGVAAIAAAAGLAGIDGRRAAVLLTGANIDLGRLTPLLQ
jgi:threonine dehydratase